MNVIPIFDRVLVKLEDIEQKSEMGIILYTPSEAQALPVSYGRVLAAGPGPMNDQGQTIPHPILEGDLVLFETGSGHEVRIDASPYLILRVDEILAKVEL